MHTKAKIVLATSTQPSLNPRLVKEADTLVDAGYDVTVLYCYWNAWGAASDKQLMATRRWNAKCIAGDPTDEPVRYHLSRILHKIFNISTVTFKLRTLTHLAVSRGSFFLSREICKTKADLYIGHNLGALHGIVKAAKRYDAKCGFDAEDLHRYEAIDANNACYDRNKYLEDKYFSDLNYLTTASPLMARDYAILYPDKQPAAILNVFGKGPPNSAQKMNDVIRLFWFSQTIGPDRGLETIVDAIKLLPGAPLELHLLGENKMYTAYIHQLTSGDQRIHIHHPIPSDHIIPFAAQFDIGIASELGIPYNRDICLTNKLFTYLQAGLAVLASDTTAQKQFMIQHPGIGQWYRQNNAENVAAKLQEWTADPRSLFKSKCASSKLAHGDMNWETESQKFLSIIERTLIGN